ncbi:MAG: DegT/DnrJ/EryC1/StrS family aminotransferase, partial [Candidatus Eisenbacteria bacterium]|nr:DegT/DnrJ/EryC1/StrS family aminotransferase [Candidatus Eisenbacteria bacterium]
FGTRRQRQMCIRDRPRGDAAREDVVHLFVVRVARRDRLRAELEARGVGTQVHYPVPIHLQPAYAGLGFGPGSFPVAERRAGQVVSLPLYPEMTDAMVETVAGALAEALRGEEPPDPPAGGGGTP